MVTSAAEKPLPSNENTAAERSDWTKLEYSFVSERVRLLLQVPIAAVRNQVRDLSERAPKQLLAQELASTIYLSVTTPESNSLDALLHVWEALDLPTRRAVRDSFQAKFGASIRSVLGHRLPAHIQAAFSW